MDLMITAHLKSNYESWKKLFDGDSARSEYCNESKTMVSKVDDKTALIVLFDVDKQKMDTRISSPEFEKLVKDHVTSHEIYALQGVG